MLVIKNGRVIDPATNTDAPRDILIDGDKIAEVAQPGSLRAVQIGRASCRERV